MKQTFLKKLGKLVDYSHACMKCKKKKATDSSVAI